MKFDKFIHVCTTGGTRHTPVIQTSVNFSFFNLHFLSGLCLRVNVSKNQRNRGHGQKIDFAHTLSV